MICQVSPACCSEMKQWHGPFFGSFLISLPPTQGLTPSIVTTRLCVSRKYFKHITENKSKLKIKDFRDAANFISFLRQPRDRQQEVMPFAFLLKHVFH